MLTILLTIVAGWILMSVVFTVALGLAAKKDVSGN